MIVKLLLAVALAAAPVSAQAPTTEQQTAVAPPVDSVARAKFPNEDGAIVDVIAGVNGYVNAKMTYTFDQEHYGYGDFWVMAPSDAKGDCEDYALTKLFVLAEMGFPIASDAKIVTVAVHEKGKTYGHAILAVRLPRGSVAYLDMRPELMTRQELEARGYEFFDWKA